MLLTQPQKRFTMMIMMFFFACNLLSCGSAESAPESVIDRPVSSEIVSSEYLSESSETTSPEPLEGDRTAYLTFDDGPTEMTPQILDVLKEHDVKATFFVVYHSDPKLAAYMKRAAEEGHEIAAHSYTHDYNKIYKSADAFFADYNKIATWVQSVTGQKPLQHRFPGGSSIGKKYLSTATLKEILQRMKYIGARHHDWNVSSGDANPNGTSKEQVVRNVLSGAVKFKEPVILMHDIERNVGTRDALPEIITELKALGYRFDTVSKIRKPAQHRSLASLEKNTVSSAVSSDSAPASSDTQTSSETPTSSDAPVSSETPVSSEAVSSETITSGEPTESVSSDSSSEAPPPETEEEDPNKTDNDKGNE